MHIPNNRVDLVGKEIEYVVDALNKGCVSGDGRYTALSASFIEKKFQIGKVLMTTSATHALELACLLIGLGPGDEAVLPSFTFPSAANAVMLRGAKPVFAEISPLTLNIDPEDVENKITVRTKAIIPVHYAGIGCQMDKLTEIAARKDLYVIEDAAQAVNAKYKNKYLGGWGHFGCYSFHGTKNFIGGEGGALVINTDDGGMVERAEIIRQKGTNRTKFLKGETDRYCWVDVGSSYSPSDVLMALLYAQLENMDRIVEKRRRHHDAYCCLLSKYVSKGLLRIMHIPPECEPNFHLFYILLPNGGLRDRVMRELNDRGVGACIHFVPLHSSPLGQKLGYKPGDLEISQGVSECLLRLPMYTGMTESEFDFVAENLKEVLEGL